MSNGRAVVPLLAGTAPMNSSQLTAAISQSVGLLISTSCLAELDAAAAVKGK
jgi:hypothetical protein